MNKLVIKRAKKYPSNAKNCQEWSIVVALEDIPANSFVLDMDDLSIPAWSQDRHSTQRSKDLHVYLNPPANLIKHSCNPNCILTSEFHLRSIRPIKQGEELTYCYLSTEWILAYPFKCLCGTKECLGSISGFVFLNAEQKEYVIKTCGVLTHILLLWNDQLFD